MKKLLILANLLLFTISFLLLSPIHTRGDIYIKKIKHTNPVTVMDQTQPAKNEEGTNWIAKNKFRIDEGNKSTIIIRLDLKKIFIINHQEKTYSETGLPVELAKILSPTTKKIVDEIVTSVNVIDTGEVQKIRKWMCKKYLIQIDADFMGMNISITQELWITEKIGGKLKHYNKFQKEILALNPLIKPSIEKINKIEGFPVLINISMKMMDSEVKTREEVISVEKKKAPPGTYDLPRGYKKSDYNPFAFLKK
jgi:hypothetical protein